MNLDRSHHYIDGNNLAGMFTIIIMPSIMNSIIILSNNYDLVYMSH